MDVSLSLASKFSVSWDDLSSTTTISSMPAVKKDE